MYTQKAQIMSSKSKNQYLQYSESLESETSPFRTISQRAMKDSLSSLIGKNICIGGRRTSVRLEPEMWDALYDIATREQATIHHICSLIALRKHRMSTLTAAIRVFLLLYYRAASTEEGHARVKHGDFATMLKRAKLSEDDIKDHLINKTYVKVNI